MKGEDLVKLEAISEDVFQQSQKRQRGMVSSALPASVGSRLGRLSFRPGDGENNVKDDLPMPQVARAGTSEYALMTARSQ